MPLISDILGLGVDQKDPRSEKKEIKGGRKATNQAEKSDLAAFQHSRGPALPT